MIARERSISDFENRVPVHVVWEITLACDLHCKHCGSRAGSRRQDEMSTEECLEMIDSLSAMGTREITLIGGEAYLRKDWLILIEAIRDKGIRCAIQSGARNFTEERIVAAKVAGLQGIGVSIDGLADQHNYIRGADNSFERAIRALIVAKKHDLKISVNTVVCKDTLSQLPSLLKILAEVGITHWQIQLAVAMGNAVDNPELLLQPYELLEELPKLANIYRQARQMGIIVSVGNNIGYFGPYESLWRGLGDQTQHWTGCSAGVSGIGIEADGTIKGCPSLATEDFSAGNVRSESLVEIWEGDNDIDYIRKRTTDDLWGFCGSCYYADVCRAGCTWTSHSLLKRAGNNPYCHYRALSLAKDNIREYIVKVEDAPDRSFSIGEFRLAMEQKIQGQYVEIDSEEYLKNKNKKTVLKKKKARDYMPEQLELCFGCHEYIWGEPYCPHCGCDVKKEKIKEDVNRQRVNSAMQLIQDTLNYQRISEKNIPIVQVDCSG